MQISQIICKHKSGDRSTIPTGKELIKAFVTNAESETRSETTCVAEKAGNYVQ